MLRFANVTVGSDMRQGGKIALLSLFFVSGISALLYQIVWLKYLGLIFGNTVYAAATLIAVFLGGLGIGAFLFRRPIAPQRLLLVYAIVEALIGSIGGFSPNAFGLLNRAYVAAFPTVHGSFLLTTLLRGALAGAFLLPPTILMGGTLPLLVRWFTGDEKGSGRAVSALYAANTCGAAAGVALAGFVLIPRLGLLATIYVAVILNFTLAGVVLLIPPRSLRSDPEARTTTSPQVRSQFILAASLLMGFAAIADEVFWSRVLVLHIGSSVYAYSLMLFSFLIGIGLGSVIVVRFVQRIDVAAALGSIELALGAALALQVHAFTRLPEIFVALVPLSNAAHLSTPFPTLLGGVMAMLVIPTALMGAAFPLTVRLYEMSAGEGEAGSVGKVYLANTVGSISGSLLAGFALIRLIGSQNGLFLMAILNVAIGAWFLRNRVMIAIATTIVAIAILAAKPAQVILSAGLFSEGHAPILVFREDVTATVTLRQLAPTYLSLELNGVNVAGTSGDLIGTQKLQGHIPLLLHANPRRVLHIGFGSGGTAWAVSRHPVSNITIAEISPEVLEVSNARLGNVNHGVLRDPRVHVEINDGRNYVMATRERFDVILSDSIHPRYAGNGSLYTRDYFDLCKQRLNPGGVISMWLPMYSLTTRNYLQIVRAFRDVFPNTTIWYVSNSPSPYTIVIGRLEGGGIPFDRVAAHWTPAVSNELSEIGIRTPAGLLPALLLGPTEVARITRDIPPHVDDLPSVEYESGRVIDRDLTWVQTFALLAQNLMPLGDANAEQRRAQIVGAHLQFAAELLRREHQGLGQ
jgi:spermidine synthase